MSDLTIKLERLYIPRDKADPIYSKRKTFIAINEPQS